MFPILFEVCRQSKEIDVRITDKLDKLWEYSLSVNDSSHLAYYELWSQRISRVMRHLSADDFAKFEVSFLYAGLQTTSFCQNC
jgi:hypothetical protein